jgi:hypothetical protein
LRKESGSLRWEEMNEWPSQYSFVVPFPRTDAMVLFRTRGEDPAVIARQLALIIAEELHLDPLEPTRLQRGESGAFDNRLPCLRLHDVQARRALLIRQVLMSDTPRGRCPVGLIHPVGFWAMFPCETLPSAERLVDRLSA